MATKTCYPQTVSQSSGRPFREFSNLSNIKNSSSSYARSQNIDGGIGSKVGSYPTPSRITAKNFKANIPANATIKSVTVEWAARKEGWLAIGKVAADLEGVDMAGNYGKALTSTMATSSVKFTSPKLTTSVVNNNNFGFTLYFPKNSTYNTGYVRVQFVRLIIDYVLPSFSFNLSKDKAECYEDDLLNINATINNINKTAYNPSVRIELPDNVTYSRFIGDGSITSSGNVLTWNPQISSKTTSRTVQITIELNTISTGNIVKITENSTKATKSLSFDIIENPAAIIEEPEEEEIVYIEPEIGEIPTVNIKQGNSFRVGCSLTSEQADNMDEWTSGYPLGYLYLFSNLNFSDTFRTFNTGTGKYEYDDEYLLNNDDIYFEPDGDGYKIQFIGSSDDNSVTIDTVGQITLVVLGGTIELGDGALIAPLELARFNLDIFPETLTTPSFSVLNVSEEELNRLGTGYNYIVQSYFKIATQETFVRNWGKNFRIGVFNNAIQENLLTSTYIANDGETEEITYDSTDYYNLTPDEIFNNAEYWSEPPTSVNEYNNLKSEFIYNENYPLYIILVGDYTEANPQATISFTEPCIVESEDFKGWASNGNYPQPIKASILSSIGNAELSLQPFEIANKIIVYDLPVGNTFDVNNVIIKGICVDFDVEYTDLLSFNVLLKSPTGETGERSIITDPSSNHISLGGPTDRWGFEPSKLINMTDWEIIIYFSNVFESGVDGGQIDFNNLTVTVYSTQISQQAQRVFIDGEDMAVYDAFILDVSLPPGLKTDSKFMENANTDFNYISKQVIREKEIEIKFYIDACTIEEASQSLQDITSLLINERNELDKPIPKRVEFSHYPGLYWEYVLKDTLDPLDSEFETSVKLVIPSGTAFAKDEIITSNTGKVGGIAKINPKIVIIPTNNHIELLESISKQKFTMTCYDWDSSCTVEIDCAERTVYLKKSEGNNLIDITHCADWDVDWFTLYGEYDFNTLGCILQSVSRTERR